MRNSPSVLILGIGNVLWADEGFGVRAVERLDRLYTFPDNVTLMDGGTQGIYLVQHVQAADLLVVFDAIDYGLPPGTLKSIEDDAVPKFLGAKKMSLHQTGFQEVLAIAEMLGGYPGHLLLVGVQPEQLDDFGGSLRPLVKARMEPAIDRALAYLARHGITATPRREPFTNRPMPSTIPLDMERYEDERPSRQAACRVGDQRVLNSDDFSVAHRPHHLDSDAISVDVDHRGKY